MRLRQGLWNFGTGWTIVAAPVQAMLFVEAGEKLGVAVDSFGRAEEERPIGRRA